MRTLTKHKFVGMSDLHLVNKNPICRKDDLLIIQWEKLNEVFEFATLKNADVLIAGDLHAVSNDYGVLSKFAEFLKSYQDYDTHVWAVIGQHDMKYRNPENTNIDVLIKAGLINLIPPEGIQNDGVKIFGCNWMDEVPNYDLAIVNILVIHAPIAPKALFSGHNYIDAWSFMYEHQFDITICGDVHRKFIEENNGKVCINSGPLLRREADDYSFKHKPGFWFINTEEITFDFIEVEHEKSKNVLSKEHIIKLKDTKEKFNDANTSKFLYELKSRTSGNNLTRIEDRIKRRIDDPEGDIKENTKEVIEILMNGKGKKGLELWLQKQLKNPKRIKTN